jgi:hypothetical protein
MVAGPLAAFPGMDKSHGRRQRHALPGSFGTILEGAQGQRPRSSQTRADFFQKFDILRQSKTCRQSRRTDATRQKARPKSSKDVEAFWKMITDLNANAVKKAQPNYAPGQGGSRPRHRWRSQQTVQPDRNRKNGLRLFGGGGPSTHHRPRSAKPPLNTRRTRPAPRRRQRPNLITHHPSPNAVTLKTQFFHVPFSIFHL